MSQRTAQVARIARDVAPEMVDLRRAIHREPEVGWTERRTTARVATTLDAHGLQPMVREDGMGLYVDLGSAPPTVGFRADLDALPIGEQNDVEYRSIVTGVMHACGHDAHAAVATGIAITLSRLDLPGGVRVFFQPAEERVPGGANTLRAEGIHRDLDALLAFHVDPSRPVGVIGSRVGPITGASDRLNVILSGPGGHTSRPHQTVDLVRVAARVIDGLPSLLQEKVDPRQTLVVVFGTIDGGEVENVIPTRVTFGGTVRVFDPELWRIMPKLVKGAIADIAAPLGATHEIVYDPGAPPVDNDEAIVRIVESTVVDILGHQGLATAHQSLGAEDFSWYLEDVPGAMFRLGAKLGDRDVDLHSATFDIDERAIEVGINVGSEALIRLLEAS